MQKWATKAACQAFIDEQKLPTRPRYFGRSTWILKDQSERIAVQVPPAEVPAPSLPSPKGSVRMRWTGATAARRTRTLELPVPLISKHDKTGEIQFTPEADVPVAVANALDRLLGAATPFQRIDGSPPKPQQTILDRCGFFESQADCRAYIDNQRGENKVMEKLLVDAEPVFMGFGRWAVTNAPIHDSEHEAVPA